MRKQPVVIQTRIRKISFLIVTVIALVTVTPALADYLGPNRTVTEVVSGACKIILNECQYVPAKKDYRYKTENTWSCSNESKPWRAYPSQPSTQGCFSGTVGDKYWEKEETTQQVTTTYTAATITGTLQNCVQNNGWCTAAAQLALTANEPVPGHSILAIEGTWNGQSFACSGASCNVPLS